MVAILLILFIILLFAALPTLPYSASGRARYHVASVKERTAPAAAKLPQFSGGEALHNRVEDYASQFRELQNRLQDALIRQPRARQKNQSLERLIVLATVKSGRQLSGALSPLAGLIETSAGRSRRAVPCQEHSILYRVESWGAGRRC